MICNLQFNCIEIRRVTLTLSHPIIILLQKNCKFSALIVKRKCMDREIITTPVIKPRKKSCWYNIWYKCNLELNKHCVTIPVDYVITPCQLRYYTLSTALLYPVNCVTIPCQLRYYTMLTALLYPVNCVTISCQLRYYTLSTALLYPANYVTIPC